MNMGMYGWGGPQRMQLPQPAAPQLGIRQQIAQQMSAPQIQPNPQPRMGFGIRQPRMGLA